MTRYIDIDVYPNSDNPDDGMKVDWWDEDANRGYTFAGFLEYQITPDETDIEDIHGNYIGRISHPANEEDYLEQLVALIEAFTA